MLVPDRVQLLATVCNTTPNAVPYSLWFAQGEQQYLVDLSEALGQVGDSGLTGLACRGERIYVAVQSSSAPRILILDRGLSPVGVIRSPAFIDIHSIHIAGNALIVCSTGGRSVIRVDLTDHHPTKLCEFDANIHLNSACIDGEELLVCCHHPSLVLADIVGGGVIGTESRRMVIAGLGQPHSLLADGDSFLVLDSDAHLLVRFDRRGIRQQQVLSGFPRGLAVCRGSIFVASSAGRIVSRQHPVVPAADYVWDMQVDRVCIHELDAATLMVKTRHFPLVAGFEIYDLLALDESLTVDPPRQRLLVPDIHAMARAYYEGNKHALAKRQ